MATTQEWIDELKAISVLDYRKGFGHTDLVLTSEADQATFPRVA